MSRNQRLALLAATLLAAAGLFLILEPEDEDEPDRPAATVTETTPAETAPAETVTESAPAEEEEPEEPAVERIEVEGGQPVGGVREIEVSKGDRVRFEVSVEEAAEIHLHGYDISKDATPERPARFDFRADVEGVFEIEVEDTKTPIAELRVNP